MLKFPQKDTAYYDTTKGICKWKYTIRILPAEYKSHWCKHS